MPAQKIPSVRLLRDEIHSRICEATVYEIFRLGAYKAAPRYWIVPDWWMRNDIYRVHQEYLGRHGGRRAKTPDSTHHAIEEKRLSEWQGKWEILGIFG
jgi:hypothetical protein